MLRNKNKILSKCHDFKHESKFWNLSRKKICESSSKKKTWVEKVRTLTSCVINQCLHFTETRLRSKVVVCWPPNIADFFFFLARLIEDLERQLSWSASNDSSEFLFRHFDEYKRTLATLSSRFCETYGCLEIGKFTLSTLNRTRTHRFNHSKPSREVKSQMAEIQITKPKHNLSRKDRQALKELQQNTGARHRHHQAVKGITTVGMNLTCF